MEETLKQQPSDCLRIVLFGPESSGKTTMARQLAEHFQTTWVPEYMRTYLQEKWDVKKETVVKDDLIPIARGQLECENRLIKSANQFLFCDTNLLEIKVYSQYYYDGFCPSEILEACENGIYDFYFLTYIDTPWEKDDLRDRPNDRQNMFRTFENELRKNKIPYSLLRGTKKERLNSAIQTLAGLKTDLNAN
jgi:NadR type nicotinamide-nucleotide adenylyltransferase